MIHCDWTKENCLIGWILAGCILIGTAAFFAAIYLFTTSQAGAAERCHVAGDSIAVGVSHYLPCSHNAKGGIPSVAVIGRVKAGTVNIISAGSNDALNPNLASNLLQIRQRANSVIWILPIHKRAAAIVRKVAAGGNDQVVTFIPSRDNVHPRSYRELAAAIKKHLK